MSDSVEIRGRVHTLDPGQPVATRVEARGGRIASIGGSTSSGSRILDFGGRTVLPGFVDPHVHLEVSARAARTMVDVRVPRCRTVADVLDTLADAARAWRAESSAWMRAQANLFFDQKLSDGRYPTLEELDRATGQIPLIIHAGGHTSLLNSAAIARSDLGRFRTGGKGAMGGAIVDLDAAGRPTGLVGEIDNLLPVIDPREEELPTTLAEGAHELFTRFGVTTIGDISETVAGVHAIAEATRDGRVPQRVHSYVCAPGTLSFAGALGAQAEFGSHDRFQVRGIKVFADGGYSSRNAAVDVEYLPEHALEPGSMGTVNLDRDELLSMIRESRAAGLQLAVHANGERAQAEVVAAGERAGADPVLPVRMEHAANLLMDRSRLTDWRSAGVVPVPQGVFLYNFGDFFPVYLGEAAATGRFSFRDLLDSGWDLCSSSDVYTGAEEMQTNPMFGIWCCVARRSFGGDHIEPAQAVTVDEALRMHTQAAANVLGLGDEVGSLSPGKAADLVVLDRSPYDVSSPDDLLDIHVDHVLVDGRLIYSRPGAEPPEAT